MFMYFVVAVACVAWILKSMLTVHDLVFGSHQFALFVVSVVKNGTVSLSSELDSGRISEE